MLFGWIKWVVKNIPINFCPLKQKCHLDMETNIVTSSGLPNLIIAYDRPFL